MNTYCFLEFTLTSIFILTTFLNFNELNNELNNENEELNNENNSLKIQNNELKNENNYLKIQNNEFKNENDKNIILYKKYLELFENLEKRSYEYSIRTYNEFFNK